MANRGNLTASREPIEDASRQYASSVRDLMSTKCSTQHDMVMVTDEQQNVALVHGFVSSSKFNSLTSFVQMLACSRWWSK